MANLGPIIGGVSALVVVVVGAVAVMCLCNKRSKSEENKLRLAARMSGLEEIEVSGDIKRKSSFYEVH